jgi:hypothetical protein
MLPTPRVSLVEEPPHRMFTLPEIESRRVGARDQDHVNIVPHNGSLGPVNLSQVTLHPVANNCLADLARYGKSKLSSLTWAADGVTDKGPSHVLPPLGVNAQVFRTPKEPFAPWIRVPARLHRFIHQ